MLVGLFRVGMFFYSYLNVSRVCVEIYRFMLIFFLFGYFFSLDC